MEKKQPAGPGVALGRLLTKTVFLSSVVIDSETLKISVPYTGTGLYIAQNL